MHTYSLGYREPAYVSIVRKYNTQRNKPKKRLSLFAVISGRRVKKLLRRHIFKKINRKFYA